MKKAGAGGMLMPWRIPDEEIRKINAEGFGLSKYLGMMFQLSPQVQQFNFDSPVTIPIHSLFCRTFIAKWYKASGELIEERIVKPFRLNIKPKQPYTKLVEIPCYLLNKHD